MFLEKIILICFIKIGKERTINSVFHILQGKTSIQTMQDVHLFQLGKYYKVYPKLKKMEYDEIIQILLEQDYMKHDLITDTFEVTAKGIAFSTDIKDSFFINGLAYKNVDDEFYNRLLLLIQVWTNSKANHYKFIPIVENPEVAAWVKKEYNVSKNNLEENLYQMYEELTTVLHMINDDYATIFVDQLSTYDHIGLTKEQLSIKYDYSIHDIALINKHIIHSVIFETLRNQARFPWLFKLQERLFIPIRLTETAKDTFTLLNQGLTLQQIAQMRRLKENTIYDHIVEIALQDKSFSIREYVPLAFEREIIDALEKLNTFRLKAIKAVVNEQITYFQIRLVLTRIREDE